MSGCCRTVEERDALLGCMTFGLGLHGAYVLLLTLLTMLTLLTLLTLLTDYRLPIT